MAKVALFHGINGSPEWDWIGYLDRELKNRGITVVNPKFPTPLGQKLDRWQKAVDPYRKDIDGDSIIVAHSLGVPFALRIIGEQPVHGAYFVSGFAEPVGNRYDPSMRTFLKDPFAWEQIRANCPSVTMYHSHDDPNVPPDRAERLAENLDAKLTWIDGAGHFRAEEGYAEFPLLLHDLEAALSVYAARGADALRQPKRKSA